MRNPRQKQIISARADCDPSCYTFEKVASCNSIVTSNQTITFCITFRISSECPGTPLRDVLFQDILDPVFTYVPGSFMIQNSPVTPRYENNTLEYLIPRLTNNTLICFQVVTTL